MTQLHRGHREDLEWSSQRWTEELEEPSMRVLRDIDEALDGTGAQSFMLGRPRREHQLNRDGRRLRFRRPDHETDLRFRRLCHSWKRSTWNYPPTEMRLMHPDYQQIIGLGAPVVGRILEELQSEVDDWFWALNAIVGVDHGEGATNPEEAAALWIGWGRNQGLVD